MGLLACAPAGAAAYSDDDEEKPWEEVAASLPGPPKLDNLVEFYVAADTANRFFIDAASLNVGTDQAIRYTAVIKSPSGANTVSFEGIRCDVRERKLYAFGHADQTWSRAKNSAWTPISNFGTGRYQYILMRDYFCPAGMPIGDAAEGVSALKRGGHPASRSAGPW